MENQKKRSPNVDKKLYDMVKILLQGGAKYKEIREYTGLGDSTISRIKSSENYADYQDQLVAMKLAWKKNYAKKKSAEEAAATKAEQQKSQPEPKQEPQTIEHRQNVTVQTTYYVSKKLDAITELLRGISAKLAFVVDELTGIPQKKEEKNNG